MLQYNILLLPNFELFMLFPHILASPNYIKRATLKKTQFGWMKIVSALFSQDFLLSSSANNFFKIFIISRYSYYYR
jgi:hypothetical protein